jgi:hypothetical protein
MSRIIEDELVEPVVRTLLGVIDVEDGPTEEQRAVLRALVHGLWERPDLDIDSMDAFAPDQAAYAVMAEDQRNRLRELIVLLELCRHPASDEQVQRADEYAAALHQRGPGLHIARTLVRKGADAAMADYMRFYEDPDAAILEPSMRDEYGTSDLDAPDTQLGDRLRALHDLPEGTLGWAYVEFYRRHGFTLPGDDPSMPAVMVAHDMCHVIAGYEPVAEGEIALGAMQLALADTTAHWIGFLGNLAVHEAAIINKEGFVGKTATLDRPGAAEYMAQAMVRGTQCTGDFTTADHLALADVPLEDVRAHFGIPPLAV